MYNSLLYSKNKSLYDNLLFSANKYGLNGTVYENDNNTLSIAGDATLHDSFISLFEKNSDVVIFKDSNHPSTRKSFYKTHLRVKNNSTTSNTSQGRTAVWYASYYNFPKLTSNPIIAIISLGGGYQINDLKTYWTTICGLSTYPTVINVPVGQNTVPSYTGAGDDFENTLDLEIVGAVSIRPRR